VARPTLPNDGVKPWGTLMRTAIFDISDRADNALSAASAAATSATSALNTANSAASTGTSNSTAIASLQNALTTKADDSVVVKTSGNQTVNGIKTFTSAPVVPDNAFAIAKVTGLQTALDNASGTTGGVSTNDSRLSDTRVPTDGSVTNVKVSASAAISADKIADGSVNHVFTVADDTKLAGIATGATANSTDAALRDRTTHTGITPVAGLGSGTPAANKYVDGATGAWTTLPTSSNVSNMISVAFDAASRPTVPTGYQLFIIGGTTPPTWYQAGDIQLASG
jgi:hypothetical protein